MLDTAMSELDSAAARPFYEPGDAEANARRAEEGERRFIARMRAGERAETVVGGGNAGPLRPNPNVPDHELMRRIGGGAYGEVWLARNVMGTYRAVKIVHRDSFDDDRPYEREYHGIQRFEPVSRSDDGFVDILQIGRNDEEACFYYVMELADDAATGDSLQPASMAPIADYVPKTLRHLARQHGRLPCAETLRFMLPLTLALGHLHRQGLIHRDIKPSNIVFIGGIPKLADIGLVTEVSEARSLVGTEGYIPPEGATSPQADIYSLGKVLYEISMGKDRLDFPEPFTALGQGPASGELEELNAVILRACAPDARDRYQSAEDMHVDLALLQSGKSVRWKRVVEKRLAAARKAAAIVAVIAALAAGGYLYQRYQTSQAKRLQQIAEVLQQRAEDNEARMQILNAESLLQRGDSSGGLAHLAHVLRRDPGNRVAAERIISALTQREFPALAARPFLHPDKLSTAHFSPDGHRIVTVCRDDTVHIWNAQTGQETIPPHRHNGAVSSAEFSPDGTKVVTASHDGTACAFNAQTGALVFQPFDHGAVVNAAIFSPDGKWIATACADAKARMFNADTGELRAPPFVHADSVNAIAFSPDGQRLATGMEGGRVRIWEVDSSQEKHRFRLHGPVHIVRFSADGKWLAASVKQSHEGGAWLVQVWDAASGESVTGPLLHQNRIHSLEFSPDSQRLVTGTADNTARIWRVESGEELFQLRHTSLVYSAAFSPNGRQILTASVDHTARLWNATTGAAVSEAMIHDGRLMHAEFNREGSCVLTVGWDDGTAKVWDIQPRHAAIKALPHQTWVVSAEFGAGGSEALTATGGAVLTAPGIDSWNYGGSQFASVWDVAAGVAKMACELPEPAEAVAAQFTRAGPKALVSEREDDDEFSKSARIWDLGQGKPVGTELQHGEEITCARFSADGLKLATGCEDGMVRIWDACTGAALTPPMDGKGRLRSVRFSADAAKLVSAGDDGTAVIWDVSTGRSVAPPLTHAAGVWFAQFNATGDKVVTVSLDYTAKIWFANGSMAAMPLQHRAPVEYAEFSPNGLRLVTASGNMARLWSAETGRQLTEPLQHSELVMSARFSPDGLRVLTASKDGTAQLWDASTGLKLGEPLRHHDGVISAMFSDDGRQAITASLDQTVRIWEVPVAREQIPPWLPELAETVAGQRLNDDRIPETVLWEDSVELQGRLAGLPATDPHVRWARSLFAEPRGRSGP